MPDSRRGIGTQSGATRWPLSSPLDLAPCSIPARDTGSGGCTTCYRQTLFKNDSDLVATGWVRFSVLTGRTPRGLLMLPLKVAFAFSIQRISTAKEKASAYLGAHFDIMASTSQL